MVLDWTRACGLRSWRCFRRHFESSGMTYAGLVAPRFPWLAIMPTKMLKALLLHLGANRAHVVGVSMGGRMALRFAAAYPEMVRSLVLADSALDGYTWSDDWQTRWKAMCESAKAGQIGEAKRQWLEHPIFHSARINPSDALLLSK